MADDLSAPLGQGKKRKRKKLPIATMVAGVLGFCVAVFLVWAAVVDDPSGGEPMVVLSTEAPPTAKKPDDVASNADTAEPKAVVPVPDPKPAEPAKGPPAGMQTVTIIDGASGNRQEVLVPSQGGAGARAAAADPKLLETTRHGSIPRISLDGGRASTVYARPVNETPAKANLVRVALVISGLGIGSSNTAEALAKLPGPVSFALAPHGGDLERLASRARGEGHEILLQLPMEPFDYPDNDPGPQTLLTSLDASQNVDRLQSLMARARGYVGVANFMGSRFSASEQALAPVLRETAKRGLIYFDDGSAPRSLAGQIAGGSSLPFAKSDVALDTVPSAAEIDRALGRLEALARERGSAIGMANALPITIDRIARWAKAAEARGVQLVPITAVVTKTRSS